MTATGMKSTLPHQQPQLVSDYVGPIFSFGGTEDAWRVYRGKLNPAELPSGDHYGLSGAECGIGEVANRTPLSTLNIPGHDVRLDTERFVFRITPNRADGVYVADNAERSRARTTVPIDEYAGGYEHPVVLINRQLDLDEVELVSGPWPEFKFIWLIADRGPEACQLLERAISSQEAYHGRGGSVCHQARKNALIAIFEYFDGDAELLAAVEEYSRQRTYPVRGIAFFLERLVAEAAESRRLGLF